MAGPKLSIEDQIADMQKKGITFEKVGIPEAKRFLRENNYYFKLKAPYNVRLHKNKDILFQVSRIKAISEKSRKTWMQNPVVHDFIILVYVYLNVIKSDGLKKHGIQELKWLFDDRMVKNSGYFEKNTSIRECYTFVHKCVTSFCNMFRK